MLLPSSNTALKTLILADDLTGACDAAVAYAGRGLQVRVLLDGGTNSFPETDNTDVLSISTASRDLPVAEALQHLRDVVSGLPLNQFHRSFKKIDSVFRGNTVQEILEAIRLFGAGLSIIAPAYPELGRLSIEGVLHVRDLAGHRQINALDELRSAGLRPYHLAAGLNEETVLSTILQSKPENNGVVYCDASSRKNLETVVRAVDRLDSTVLWIGSAGLAHALVTDQMFEVNAFKDIEGSPGTLVLFIGSDHPVTKNQVASLCERDDVLPWAIDEDISHGPATAGATLALIQCGHTTEDDVRRMMMQIAPHNVSCLFMTGGDTAALVCHALGIHSLELRKEFAPGMPQGIARGGRFAGRTVVLKSGGFGEANVLHRVVERFARKKEVCIE